MGLSLSEPQLDQIAGVLFLLKQPPSPSLPVPVNTDDTTNPDNLAARMQSVATDERFKAFGIGVIDFKPGVTTPRVWLFNEDIPWRIASGCKINILLAAVQLRDDVRKVKATGLISTPSDFDELFFTIWKRSKERGIQDIAGSDNGPRISTIFDLSKTPPDFVGADVPLDKAKLSHIGDVELKWSGVPDLTFWELLSLCGAQSENVAATALVSEIGVAYMKAVQRAYGLYDGKTRRMLMGAAYAGVPRKIPVSRTAGAANFRPLTHKESTKVTDFFVEFDPATHKPTPSKWSTQGGSAAAQAAFMLALMQDKLPDKDGCDTLKTHLADETGLNSSGPTTTDSLILEGVNPIATVTKAHTKLGILDASKAQAKEHQVNIRSEFAYVETANFKFGVVAAGLQPKRVSGHLVNEVTLGTALGEAVIRAFMAPP
jgi:hypothetical protein